MEEKNYPNGDAAKPEHEKGDDELLPGFRFHPTDQELINFYLRRKVLGKPLRPDIIKEMDVYRYDPWDIPKADVAGENEWYFFSQRGRKYRNSIRPNRVTGSGFWKATGIDRPVHAGGNADKCIGLKKSLVYYRGAAGKGTKTDWMMHEYRLLPPDTNDNFSPSAQDAEVWTLCRILKRARTYKRQPQILRAEADASAENSSSNSCLESEVTANYMYPPPILQSHTGAFASNGETYQSQIHWNLIPQYPSPTSFHQGNICSYPSIFPDDPQGIDFTDADAILDCLYTH